MVSLDLQPLMQPLLEVAAMVASAMVAAYVPKAIAAFEARTGVLLTDQQRATVLHAVQTAAGVIETRLDQGALQVAQVNVGHPAILAEAQAAIDAVPTAAHVLGVTPEGVARMIVGAVNTRARTAAPAHPSA